ncbi:hypothetical protein ACFQZ4_36935 [Catellatospora coxensis]|uniref:Uncharacterized protein n=1 Tax=Catellatospora coxensis TaxID=310354 RepID=A0A8J3L9C8_9ACTN|nr:hypothetical protein Cco03nite_53550 [Catellatospora coxensis]
MGLTTLRRERLAFAVLRCMVARGGPRQVGRLPAEPCVEELTVIGDATPIDDDARPPRAGRESRCAAIGLGIFYGAFLAATH